MSRADSTQMLSQWLVLIVDDTNLRTAAIVMLLALIVSSAWSFRRATSRLLATAAACTATLWCAGLLMLLQPPRWSHSAPSAVYWTDGASPSQLGASEAVALVDQSLLNGEGVDEMMADRVDRDSPTIVSATLRAGSVATSQSTIEIRGFGLPDWQWRHVPADLQVSFEPASVPVGFAAIASPVIVESGAFSAIQVELHGPFPDTAQVAVFDGEFRLARSSATETTSLTLPPLAVGRYVLETRLIDGEDMIAAESVAIQVVEPPKLSVLLLQSAPSFELRALRDLLQSNNAQIAIRSQVSEARFRSQYSGVSPLSLEQITADVIAKFDLVIADATAYAALSDTERSVLAPSPPQTAGDVAGVLIVAHDPQDAKALVTTWPELIRPLPQAQVAFRLDTRSLAGAAAYDEIDPTDRVAVILDSDRFEPILRSTDGAIIAGRIQRNIAVSLLRDTYSWRTTNQELAYATLWSGLISDLARPNTPRRPFSPVKRARVFQRWPLCVNDTQSPTLRVATPAGARYELPLTDSVRVPGQRCSVFRPDVSGWYQLSAALGSSQLYVYPNNSDRVARALHSLSATKRVLGSPSRQSNSTSSRIDRPLPRSPILTWVIALGLLTALLQRLSQRALR
ncbi:MAG: hypothetical protein AAGA84_02390 [Pseudomonadota bacterium]